MPQYPQNNFPLKIYGFPLLVALGLCLVSLLISFVFSVIPLLATAEKLLSTIIGKLPLVWWGVFERIYKNFTQSGILLFQSPSIFVRKFSLYHLFFGAIFLSYNCYYEHINGKAIDITEDIPFDLPNNWCWSRLSSFSKILGGKRIPAGRQLTNTNTGHIYIKVSDMKNGSVNIEKLQYVPDDIFPTISRYIIKKEDIYITVAGTIGRIGCIPESIDGANLTENADRIIFDLMNKSWLKYALQSETIQNQIKDATTKVGQPKLAIVRIEKLLIPVPPLAEQKRIVEKIDEIFAKL